MRQLKLRGGKAIESSLCRETSEPGGCAIACGFLHHRLKGGESSLSILVHESDRINVEVGLDQNAKAD